MTDVLQTRFVRQLGAQPSEVLLVFCLDAQGRCVAGRQVESNSMFSAALRYRDLFSFALGHAAKGVMLAHNHPSGSVYPSATDISSTHELEALASVLEVELVDHLIVTNRTVFSMRKAGLLSPSLTRSVAKELAQ